ncbi:uncharacterized protein F4822DRAFT_404761 [Hypoxylon trugodes]|uniref:uncharacterized protein n=1 Tax=Hypoxylon trugodes TaxID=326681 RepID=UPI002192FA9D|nr:uncharacterized protein F4822DRAFT_404761 [Hypoxylon trugodes]KAI1389035.1 hypothetical protein F4822DRAFT_404761 [Hypoxylon trugodes]
MRFSTTSAVLSLPLLAVADVPEYQAQFDNYLGQAQSFLGKVASKIPHPNKYDPVAAAEAKAGSLNVDILALDNWKQTLYAPVKEGSTTPEEWWVLITGGNKTCFGHCGPIETAFNETAGKWAVTPGSPHTAIVNCEDQPVLCNSWSAPVGAVWIFEILPEPAPVDIWTKRFNMTTVTSDDIVALQKEGHKSSTKLHDGFFHPFNGPLAKNGVATPVGWVLWAFNLLPSWAFMVLVSIFSRTMMSNRMAGTSDNRRPAAAGQAAPRR